MKKICFVGLDNYPVLNPDKGAEYFGGESVQQSLLAKAFCELGYKVSMIVKDHGQQQGEIIDDIRVWKTFREEEGIPVARFLHPRLTTIWQALKNADADIYYQSCAGSLTGFVAGYCKRYKKKFVFRIASDSDCMPSELLIRSWRDKKIYEYGIRRANLIAAQGEHQSDLLKRNYGLESTPVNMVVELPESGSGKDTSDPIDILWVNNIRSLKRPELVLEAAVDLPEYRFVMIGGPMRGYERLFEDLKQRAAAIHNLKFLGAIPYHKVNYFFSKARIFINTSDMEGFPNSFLQAWSRHTPIVSFFDPDGLLAREKIGLVAKNLPEMIGAIRNYLEDESLREAAGDKAHEFVLSNFSPVAVARKYEHLFGIESLEI